MAIVIIRHGERVDRKQKGWTQNSQRPWDTPLTHNGKDQAFLSGLAIAKACEEYDLPLPSRCFSSPLHRCVQTATGVIKGLNATQSRHISQELNRIKVDHSLAESVCEHWYRSWGIDGVSDATWGGPSGYETGKPIDSSLLKPAVHKPAHELFLTPKQHQALMEEADVQIDTTYESTLLLQGQWGQYEDEHQAGVRVGAFAEKMHAELKGKETIVLVSHGRPSIHGYEYLTNTPVGEGGTCGYCGITILVPSYLTDGKWQCLRFADSSHLGEGADLGLSSAFLAAETNASAAMTLTSMKALIPNKL